MLKNSCELLAMRGARFWLTELAFAVDKLKSWRERLQSHGVAIEGERAWSVYFRGPDGHLVELAMPGCGQFVDGYTGHRLSAKQKALPLRKGQ